MGFAVFSVMQRAHTRGRWIAPYVFLFVLALVFRLETIANFRLGSVVRVRSQHHTMRNRTLVVVNGQLRGGERAWTSLLKHAVPANADLALFVPQVSLDKNPNSSLIHEARFVNTVKEYEDWGVVLDEAVQEKCPSEKGKWRRLCDYEWQFLGGVAGGCKHMGSSGILLAYRYMVQKWLEAKIEKYDWVVYTRSDYLYLCDVPPNYSADAIHVRLGEEYGGYSDRHTVMPRALSLKALNITLDLVCNSDWYLEMALSEEMPSLKALLGFLLRERPRDVTNLETMLKVYFHERAALQVKQFPFPGFTVRRPEGDDGRWSGPQDVEEFDLLGWGVKIKYVSEFEMAKATCGGLPHT